MTGLPPNKALQPTPLRSAAERHNVGRLMGLPSGESHLLKTGREGSRT